VSGAAVARYLLANDAALTAVVAADKIKAGIVPINTTLPAISIRQISGIEHEIIKRGSNQLVTDRVQVTVLALTYPQQKSILNLIRAALPGTRGTVNSFAVDSILPESDGPDFYNEDPVIYEQSIDYMIRFVR
jgi:hypothetical protein